MIRLLLLVIVVVLVVRLIMRFSAQQRSGVQIHPAGISVRDHGIVSLLNWDEIRQIDVCRMPTPAGNDFSVVLFGNSMVTISDRQAGFGPLAQAMFARWPDIRAEWERVKNGPPDISERVTVWERKAA